LGFAAAVAVVAFVVTVGTGSGAGFGRRSDLVVADIVLGILFTVILLYQAKLRCLEVFL